MATHVNAYKQDLEDKSSAAIKAISELKQAADALAARLEQDYTEPETPEATNENQSQPDTTSDNQSTTDDTEQAGPGVDEQKKTK